MKVKRLFCIVATAALAVAFTPQQAQARKIEIHTFNGPSRRTPPPPAHVPDANEMQVGKLVWASANVDDSGKFAVRADMYTKFY